MPPESRLWQDFDGLSFKDLCVSMVEMQVLATQARIPEVQGKKFCRGRGCSYGLLYLRVWLQ